MSSLITNDLVAVTKARAGGLHIVTYANELEAVTAMLDDATLGGRGCQYGDPMHLSALRQVEIAIKSVRAAIKREAAKEKANGR